MEPDLLTSIIGLVVFTVVVFFGYRYANGQWNVSEEKREDYDYWLDKHSKTVKRSIIIISVIYYSGMLVQLFNL